MCPGTTFSPHWVCEGDDVSVKYKSVERYENKSDGTCMCVLEFLYFMNGYSMKL